MTPGTASLQDIHEALVTELEALEISERQIEITTPPFGPKYPEVQILLKYNLSDDGDAENGPHLSVDPISWVSLRADEEGWYIILTNWERFPTEEESIEYANSAHSWEQFVAEDPDAIIRLSKTNPLSSPVEVAKEVRLLISAFKN